MTGEDGARMSCFSEHFQAGCMKRCVRFVVLLRPKNNFLGQACSQKVGRIRGRERAAKISPCNACQSVYIYIYICIYSPTSDMPCILLSHGAKGYRLQQNCFNWGSHCHSGKTRTWLRGTCPRQAHPLEISFNSRTHGTCKPPEEIQEKKKKV